MDGNSVASDQERKGVAIQSYMDTIEEKPDIIAFAENLIEPNQMQIYIGREYKLVENYPREIGKGYALKNTKYISIYSNQMGFKLLSAGYPRNNNFQLSILEVRGKNILIGCVHLPSKFKRDLTELYSRSKEFIIAFEDKEFRETVKFDGSIVFGDFNSNPFERAMTKHDSWHAINVDFEPDFLKENRYFINPTASLVGSFVYKSNISKPPGTVFHQPDKHKENDLIWNMLDGVIYRPTLHSSFIKEEFEILSQLGEIVLFEDNKILPGYSKHLPITFKFEI